MPGSPGTERLLELMQRVSVNMRSSSAETWPDLELTEPRLRALLSCGPVPMSVPTAERGTGTPAATSLTGRLVAKGRVPGS